MSEKDWIIRIGADEYRTPDFDTVWQWALNGRLPNNAAVWSPEDGIWRAISEIPELARATYPVTETSYSPGAPVQPNAKPVVTSGCTPTALVVVIALLSLVVLFAIIVGIASTSRERTSSSTPSPSIPSEWRSPLASLWTGVKLYDAQSKQVVCEVLGGNEKYLTPSGRRIRGLKVRYPDGTIEWKDRDWVVDSGELLIRSDDPAIQRREWYEYEY